MPIYPIDALARCNRYTNLQTANATISDMGSGAAILQGVAINSASPGTSTVGYYLFDNVVATASGGALIAFIDVSNNRVGTITYNAILKNGLSVFATQTSSTTANVTVLYQ